MISATCAAPVTDLVVRHWVLSASEEDYSQRRTNLRYPFLRAARMTRNNRTLRALTRDISPRGIGLLHRERVDEGPLSVSVVLGKRVIDLRATICWTSREAKGGWWSSGGRLSRVSSLKYSSLILSTFKQEVERRYHRRYPFFQSVTIVDATGGRLLDDGYSVDISESGMGILVSRPFTSRQSVHLRTASQIGSQIDIASRVVSCRELVTGWYVVGVKFAATAD